MAKKRDTIPQFGADPLDVFYDQESKSKVDIHLNVYILVEEDYPCIQNITMLSCKTLRSISNRGSH